MAFEQRTCARLVELHQIYSSLLPKNQRFLYLAGLAVHANFRNQRLGTQLFEWGMEYACKEDCVAADER
jgi:predicted N-acetyltransferase YhbS